MTLSDFIALRHRLGLTQREVSIAFGYHPAHIGQVECGVKRYLPVYYLALAGFETGRDGTAHDGTADRPD